MSNIELARLALGVACTGIVVHRLIPRARDDSRGSPEVILGWASALAFVGVLWVIGCLWLGMPSPLLWLGLVVAFGSSSAYIVIQAIRRTNAGEGDSTGNSISPSPPASPAASGKTIPARRVYVSMFLTLGVSGGIGAIRLGLWLQWPFILLSLGAWVVLVVDGLRDGFRRRE
jgi:hypothetical protein